ncbi:MAG: threonine/serine exporter family protein [Clostridia bacterium]|nr:threonine/serine exporter family protein [Clostridia bacterium]MBR2287764.1 threonine/serine exporter family protein [Clostridia bacterium]
MRWEEALITALASFAGTLGFAILLRAPRRTWIPASLVGALAYTLYCFLLAFGVSEAASIFLGSLAGSLLGQFLARYMKVIGTIFNTLAIVAFVPGLGLYRCMELLAAGNTEAGARAGVSAMISIVMIALGLAMGTFLFRAIFRPHRAAKGK